MYGYFCIGCIDFLLKVRMRKIYCTKCKKYKEFKKPKISYFFDKTFFLSSICNKCRSEDEKIFKEEGSMEIQNILGSINNIKNTKRKKKDISQEFILKNIDETTNYFLEEIGQKELMSRKHRKVCSTRNYIEHFLILTSTVTGCISISVFASLLGIPIRIISSAI